MKGIETPAVITGIRAKVDGSLGLSVGTPELTPEEKVLFMGLQNLNVKMTIEPLEEKISEKHSVEKSLDGKSPSERLYNVIYVYYKSLDSVEDFQLFYKRHMENLIDQYKERLPK